MEFDYKKLEYYVKLLSENYKLKLEDLEKYPAIKESYEAISNINICEASEAETSEIEPSKKHITNLILKQYRPSEIMPETIGSFLFGCFQKNYGDIPSQCSPLCAYSINGNSTMSMEKCDSQIHVQYSDDVTFPRFVKLGTSKSRQGYVFVNLNFLGFTQQEKEYFREAGLYKLQALVTKNSKHHTVLKMRDLEQVPIIEKSQDGLFYINSESTMNSMESYKEHDEDPDSTILYIVFAVVIIVAIIAMTQRNI